MSRTTEVVELEQTLWEQVREDPDDKFKLLLLADLYEELGERQNRIDYLRMLCEKRKDGIRHYAIDPWDVKSIQLADLVEAAELGTMKQLKSREVIHNDFISLWKNLDMESFIRFRVAEVRSDKEKKYMVGGEIGVFRVKSRIPDSHNLSLVFPTVYVRKVQDHRPSYTMSQLLIQSEDYSTYDRGSVIEACFDPKLVPGDMIHKHVRP